MSSRPRVRIPCEVCGQMVAISARNSYPQPPAPAVPGKAKYATFVVDDPAWAHLAPLTPGHWEQHEERMADLARAEARLLEIERDEAAAAAPKEIPYATVQ